MNKVATPSRWKEWVVPAICLVTLLIPVLVWFVSTGSPLAYLTHSIPPGQGLFVLAKLCALLGLALFWLQCMTALARFSPALNGFVHFTRRQHILLGCTTFVLIASHVTLFIAAGTLRTGHVPLVLLVPQFDAGYYNLQISMGAIALWLLLLAIAAGALRTRRGPGWRRVHRVVFIVFALGMLHGMTIGSETRFGLMKYVYAFVGLSLMSALASWMWFGWKRRVQRARADISMASASLVVAAPLDER